MPENFMGSILCEACDPFLQDALGGAEQGPTQPEVMLRLSGIDIHSIFCDAEITKEADKLYDNIKEQKAYIKANCDARGKLLKLLKAT